MQIYFAAIKRGDAGYIAWFPGLDLAVTGERYSSTTTPGGPRERQARGAPMPPPSDMLTLWERDDVRKLLAGDHGYLVSVSIDLE